MLPDSTSKPETTLQHLLEFLTGSQLMEIVTSSNGSTIRLDWQLPAATKISGPTRMLRLVLTGQPNLFYLSYAQTTTNRQPITDKESIRSKNLILQGARLGGSQTLILYGHSPQQVEAGELQLNFKNFQLYNEHYGRISAPDLLLHIKDQVKTD